MTERSTKVETATDAAVRIVKLRAALLQPVEARLRDVMTAEQRTLWDAFFRDEPYERIEALSRWN